MSGLFFFIIVVLIVVFVHELGHFLFARMFGVHVEIFSIGFGKTLFKTTDKLGTEWRISMIPLGGYIKMLGDKSEEEFKDNRDSLSSKENWKKMLIVLAGPFASYLLAIFIFTFMLFHNGILEYKPIINSVENSMLFEQIQAGDLILEVNGSKVENAIELRQKIIESGTKELELLIQRGFRYHKVSVVPVMKELTDQSGKKHTAPYIGVKIKAPQKKEIGFFDSFLVANKNVFTLSGKIFEGIIDMFTKKDAYKNVAGPIKIAELSSLYAEQGLYTFLSYIAIISINLAVFNMLPIPVLDGGHFVFYLIDSCFGKRISQKFQNFALPIGFGILMFLTLLALFNDFKGFF